MNSDEVKRIAGRLSEDEAAALIAFDPRGYGLEPYPLDGCAWFTLKDKGLIYLAEDDEDEDLCWADLTPLGVAVREEIFREKGKKS